MRRDGRARFRRSPLVPWRRRLLLVVLAVMGAFGLVLLMLPVGDVIGARKGDPGIGGAVAPLLDGLTRPASPPRLVVESQRAFANEPLPLGVALNGASG